MPDLIYQLQSKGFTFVTVSELIKSEKKKKALPLKI